MDTPRKLNHSSPIVQRVLHLREQIALCETTTEKVLTPPRKYSVSADSVQTRTSYQWQMWQKSDFSAYTENESEHRCKGMGPPLSPGQEEDAIEVQDVLVLSHSRSS